MVMGLNLKVLKINKTWVMQNIICKAFVNPIFFRINFVVIFICFKITVTEILKLLTVEWLNLFPSNKGLNLFYIKLDRIIFLMIPHK